MPPVGNNEDLSSGRGCREHHAPPQLFGQKENGCPVWMGCERSHSEAGLAGRQLLHDSVLLHLIPVLALTFVLCTRKKCSIDFDYINFDLEEKKKKDRLFQMCLHLDMASAIFDMGRRI